MAGPRLFVNESAARRPGRLRDSMQSPPQSSTLEDARKRARALPTGKAERPRVGTEGERHEKRHRNGRLQRGRSAYHPA